MFFYLAEVALPQTISSTVADGGIDINQIAHLSNGNPAVMLALGAVAILGGKKVWDILKQRQEQKHEEKLAEIEAQKSLNSNTGHEQCVAKQEILETQVQVLRTKINELGTKAIEADKAAKETIEKSKETFVALDEEVKKLKKKVKKIKEESEEEKKSSKKKEAK
jgi:hypothetical protein